MSLCVLTLNQVSRKPHLNPSPLNQLDAAIWSAREETRGQVALKKEKKSFVCFVIDFLTRGYSALVCGTKTIHILEQMVRFDRNHKRRGKNKKINNFKTLLGDTASVTK